MKINYLYFSAISNSPKAITYGDYVHQKSCLWDWWKKMQVN